MAEGDYQIGYGKPPKSNRFRPGRSGNPRGRPKGTHSVVSALRKVAAQKIKVKDRNGERFITKHDAIFSQLVNKAASGDIRAILEYIHLVQSLPEEPQYRPRKQVIIEFVAAKDGRPDDSVPSEVLIVN